MILDEEQLNNNFSLEESNHGTVVLKYKGQEIVCLKYCANSNSIGNDSMFPVLNLISSILSKEKKNDDIIK